VHLDIFVEKHLKLIESRDLALNSQVHKVTVTLNCRNNYMYYRTTLRLGCRVGVEYRAVCTPRILSFFGPVNIIVECEKNGIENRNTHFFTVTVIEDALRLRLEMVLSPILLASSALVDGRVARTERLPGAVDTGGTLAAGSKVSVAVEIKVVPVRGAYALEAGRRECESVSTEVEHSKAGEGVTFSTGVLETGGTECELVVTEPGKGVAETRMTGRLSPASTGGVEETWTKMTGQHSSVVCECGVG
jgi:hypothetical protein